MRPVELRHAARLLNPGPTVIVGSAHRGRRNLMAAAWSMPVEFDPPRVVVSIDKATCTRQWVEASGVLSISVPGPALADLTFTLGSISGHEIDKTALPGLRIVDGPELGLPLVSGCIAWLELRRLPEPQAEARYDTVFGEVVSAQADDRVFANGRWTVDDANPELHTIHHLGGGLFVSAGAARQAVRLG